MAAAVRCFVQQLYSVLRCGGLEGGVEGRRGCRPVILGLQGAIQAPGLVLAGLCGEGQACPEVTQQLIAGQHHSPALLLQGLCQVCHWGYAHQAALLVQRDCGMLRMQVL